MSDWGSVTIDVQRTTYPTPVNVVDGVPQCTCCQEPMVEVSDGQWMCTLGVKLLDYLAAAIPGEQPDLASLT